MREKRGYPAWRVLLGVILVRGASGGGINMTSSLFLLPVSQELGVGIGSLSISFSISSIAMVLFLPVAGKLMHRYDARLLAALGALLQAGSFAALGLMKSVYGWYALAIPQAVGAAIVVNLLGPILINRWFPNKAGTMLGIQMACVSLCGAAFQPLVSRLIELRGWRNAYLEVGGAVLTAAVLAGTLLLRDHPVQQRERGPSRKEGTKTPGRGVEVDEKTALRSVSFYLLLAFMTAITGFGVFTQHIPAYGALLGFPAVRIGTALSLASIGSAAGSVAIGVVSDRAGSLRTACGMIGLGFLAVAGFALSSDSFAVFSVSAFLHGLVTASVMVLAPILTLAFYGKKDYEGIYAKVSMGAPLASILLIPAYGFIYDLTGGYLPVLLGMAALLLISAVCILTGWKKRCTPVGCP